MHRRAFSNMAGLFRWVLRINNKRKEKKCVLQQSGRAALPSHHDLSQPAAELGTVVPLVPPDVHTQLPEDGAAEFHLGAPATGGDLGGVIGIGRSVRGPGGVVASPEGPAARLGAPAQRRQVAHQRMSLLQDVRDGARHCRDTTGCVSEPLRTRFFFFPSSRSHPNLPHKNKRHQMRNAGQPIMALCFRGLILLVKITGRSLKPLY